MKQHFIYTERATPAEDGGKYDKIPVGLDVVVGDAVMDLVESGIDEDAHFWGSSWRDLDIDELEFALNDSTTMLKLGEYIRPMLVDKLREVLADLKAEKARHPDVG
jgi:hypothetical protein